MIVGCNIPHDCIAVRENLLIDTIIVVEPKSAGTELCHNNIMHTMAYASTL